MGENGWPHASAEEGLHTEYPVLRREELSTHVIYGSLALFLLARERHDFLHPRVKLFREKNAKLLLRRSAPRKERHSRIFQKEAHVF